MDHDRFRKRAKDLWGCADLVGNLKEMPDRATPKDFQQVADLMAGAAEDLEALVKAKPPGCICHRNRGDAYESIDYDEGCLHHGQLHALSKRLETDYAKMEKVLKNEVRMRLVTAALSGAAATSAATTTDYVAACSIKIADEVLRLLTETT